MFGGRGQYVTLAWLSVLVVALLDYMTGYEIGVFAFYFIPVSLGAWEAGRPTGLILASTCTVTWLAVDYATLHTYSREWYRYENALIRGVAFAILAILIARIRTLVEKERETAAKEIRALRGLLPICASCKKIRTDEGNWEQIESYITARSATQFSHGICPECARRLYPEFLDER